MDLKDAEVFFRVIEDGSLTAAAQRLGRPKSSISRSLARLEDELGVRLLMRTTRRIHLSDAGHALYRHLHSAFQELEEAEAEVRERQAQPQGHLRITMPVELGLWFVGPLIAEFMMMHPKVSIEADLSGRLVNLVEEGMDLALRIGEFSDSSLVARKLGLIARRWVASPDYLARCGHPQSLDDLAEHEIILFPRGRENRLRVVDCRDGHQTQLLVHGRLTVSNLTLSVQAAVAGLGIALVSPYLCERELAQGQLVTLLEHHRVHDGGLYAMYPSRQHLPTLTRMFIDFLAERLGHQGWLISDGTVKASPA